MPYALRPGLSFCRPGDRTIFLDIRNDRYFCLGAEAERGFAVLRCHPDADPADHPALSNLLKADLLVEVEDFQPLAPCPPPPLAARSWLDTSHRASLPETLLMATRLASADAAIRRRPLHRILDNLARRKARLGGFRSNDRSLRDVAAALRRCGTLITPLDRCLPRSLATAHRLLDRQVEPTLVLGVKLGPFEAHAWVQHGAGAVNDSVDHVRRFTPILVI